MQLYKSFTKAHWGYFILLSVLFVTLDQLVKIIMVRTLVSSGNFIEIFSFFKLFLVFNKGVSFSFLFNLDYKILLLLSFLALIFALFLLGSVIEKYSFRVLLALSLLIGGSLGNFIDRAIYKSVVDYLYFSYGNFYFPIFNLADCMITLCVLLILKDILFTKTTKSTEYKK